MNKTYLKIIIPALFTIVLFALTVFIFIIPQFEENILRGKREMMKELTNSAISILSKYENDEKSGVLTIEEAQNLAVSRIKYLRYGKENKDYFWINDLNHKMIMHPYRADLDNKILTKFEDPRGKKIFVEFVNIVKKSGEGYVDYMWQWKDDSTKIVPKLSFVKIFKPWGWVIGTGVYIEDVKQEIKTLTRNLLLISLIISIFIAILLFFISQQSLRIELKRKKTLKSLKEKNEEYAALNEEYKTKTEELFRAKIIAEESETRYKMLINNTAFPIVVSNFSGEILFSNDSANKFLENESGNIENISDFWKNPNERINFINELKQKGKIENFEAEVKNYKGEEYILLVNSNIISYNGETAIYNVYNDITKRKQTELKLKEKNEEYEALNEELHQTNSDLFKAKTIAEDYASELKEAENRLKIKLDYILSPEVSIENLSLTDIVELEELQNIQDAFVNATGVASIITDLEGKPITKPSNFSEVCKLIRATKKGRENCFTSDKLIGLKSIENQKICYEKCHSCGFIDAGAPIIVAGQQIAIWMIGQSNVGEVDENRILNYANEIGADGQEMLKEYLKMPNMSLEQFENVTKLLEIFAQEISTLAFNNIKLAKKLEEQKALELEKTRLSKILEVSLNEVYVIDSQTLKFKFANQSALNNLKYSFDEIVKMTPADISSDFTIDSLHKLGEQFYKDSKKLIVFETNHKRKDGTTYPVEVNLQLFIENDERLLFAFVIDITERKQIQENLLKSEIRYKFISENTADVIWVMDIKTLQFTYVSPSSINLRGYTPEEILSQKWDESFTPESLQKLQFLIENEIFKRKPGVLKPDKYISIIDQYHKDGSIIPTEVSSTLVFDEKGIPVTIIGVTRDISERLKIENELKQSEYKFRNIFNSSSDGILILDTNYNILNVNETLLALLGFELKEAINKSIFLFVSSVYYDVLKERSKIILKNKPVDSIELEVLKKNGDYIPVELNSKLIEYENNNAILVIVRDITERKSVELQILKNVIETEEKERMHFSQELHDGIGPLLSATKMYIQWLGMPNANVEKSEIIKDTEKLIDESFKTVRDISFKLSPHVLQNYGLVDAVKTYTDKIKESSEIEINVISEKIERFDENAETISYRVLCECINNTIKHAEASKIEIKISCENEFLKVKYFDNGKGFDLNKVMSKYKGIGLLNMKSRIKSINGFMDIKSNLGEGTIIDFKIKMR